MMPDYSTCVYNLQVVNGATYPINPNCQYGDLLNSVLVCRICKPDYVLDSNLNCVKK